jgi:hypothetical protein
MELPFALTQSEDLVPDRAPQYGMVDVIKLAAMPDIYRAMETQSPVP